jgi:hypothetical protein
LKNQYRFQKLNSILRIFLFFEVEKGIYNKIPIPPAIMPVPIAEAPNVKIAKSLKYANQKLEIK